MEVIVFSLLLSLSTSAQTMLWPAVTSGANSYTTLTDTTTVPTPANQVGALQAPFSVSIVNAKAEASSIMVTAAYAQKAAIVVLSTAQIASDSIIKKQDALAGNRLVMIDYTALEKIKLGTITGTNTRGQTLNLSRQKLLPSISDSVTMAISNSTSIPSFTPLTGIALVGGVLTNTQPSATQVIDVATKYGILADGSTDNATALMQMRSDLIRSNKLHYNLIFPTGEVRYSNNKWLLGINNFDVYGNNTTFRTIYTGSDEALQRPFYVGSMFQDNALTYVGSVNYTSPSLVNTVSAGALSLTLTTASEASNYAVGNRIFLYGYDQVGFGFPPGDRYFEWHEIAAISGGVIKLKRPLVNSYNSAWRDVPGITGTGSAGGSGKPRIINLDRTNYTYPRHAGFHNIVFGNNTGGGSGSVVFTAEDLFMERCKGEGFFWPSENRYATYEKMDVREVEFDKLCDIVTCNSVLFSGSPNGGGAINTIRLNNCQAGESARFNSRYVEIRNSTLRGNTQPDAFASAFHSYPGTSPVRRAIIENLTFSSTANNRADYYINFAPFNQFTISALLGSSIVIPVVNGQTDQEVKDKVEAGITRLFRDDGTKGGLITSVTKDDSYNSGQGAYVIAGNWGKDVIKTGTITTTAGSPTVTGTGTSFFTDLQIGRAITSGTNYLGKIASITSNTSLTLQANTVSVVTGLAISQSNAPRVGETWKWSYVKEIIDLGRHRVLNSKPLWDGASGRWSGNRSTGTDKETHLTKRDFKLTSEYELQYNAYIKDIEVIVTKLCAGRTASTILSVATIGGNGEFNEVLKVNLLKTGRRRIGQFGSYPATATDGDAYSRLSGGFVKQVNLNFVNASFTQVSDLSVDTLPDFELIVHWREF